MAKSVTHWITVGDVEIIQHLIKRSGQDDKNTQIDIEYKQLSDSRVMKTFKIKDKQGYEQCEGYIFTLGDLSKNVTIKNESLGINI